MKCCSQCGFPFNESPILYNIRLRTNGPVICQECLRINRAEERAIKRKKEADKTPLEKLVGKARCFKMVYGKISPSLLMSKFKLTKEDASRLIQMCEK